MSAERPVVNDVFDEAPAAQPQIAVDNLDGDSQRDKVPSPPVSNRDPPISNRSNRTDGANSNREAPKVNEQDVAKASRYVNTKTMVSQQRSNLLTNNDRHQQEIGILRPLEVGSGIIGTSKIDLKNRKRDVCGIDSQKDLPQNDELIRLLQTDGLYIDSSLMFKNKDINVQKLEERLLNTGQREYFKHNGEIKINNDLLADELTRPADLAFEQSDAFQTVEQNAIVTDRMNSFKKRYYRIDIIVGKLLLKKHKDLFSKEDQMMIDLKQMCKVYDRRVSLALIPFYMERIDFLANEIDVKMENESTPKKDIQFLRRMRDNIQTDLENEKKEIAKSAQKIYDLWQAIETERSTLPHPSTFYDLKVHQGNDGSDVLFNLKKRNVQGNPAGPIEKIKRQAESTLVYCKLIIDGMEVAQTRKIPINWPSFEVDILDQFQIFVFTLPNKVELELYFNDYLTDKINLVIPGSHVKSLTSASRLIKEYEFSKRELYLDQQMERGIDLRKDQNEMDDVEKKYLKNEVEKMEKMDIDGSIFVKAEWDGYGEQMPPARSESIFNNNQNDKNRNYYTKQEQHTIFQEQRPLDVNDPRNEDIIKSIQMMKNDYLDKLLTNDSKYQLHDIESFRHKLLKARQNDPEYAGIPIPQVNSELINGEISKYYVDWLEQVHRDETFKAYLAQKQEQEQQQDLGSSERNALSAGMFDAATLSRRQQIFDDINKRRKISQQGISSNQQVPYTSIISEPQFERGENILELIGNLFTFQRKLKPKVKKRQIQSYESLPECKMLFHVIRATDVPIRLQYYEDYDKYISQEGKQGKRDKSGFQKYDDIFQEKQVETFVEIKLVNTETHEEVILKTQSAEGQYPEWNEILAYTLKAKDKISFKKTELEQSPIIIYFTLFDQLVQSEQITKMRTMTYRENRYLGYFCVPLTTILKGSKFEGQIKLERPLVIQGYRVMEDDIVFMQKQGLEEHEKRNEEQIPTYMNITISLEPLISLPRENEREYYQGFEKGPFLQVGSEWVKILESKFFKQQRQYKVFLENIKGQSVFIPKFLTPLKPHSTFYSGPSDKKAIEKSARYVSLIPYLEDSALFKDMPDLTCTSQQFLDLGMGDSEEHSMLLCNYFNFIDRDQGRQKMNPQDAAKKFDINSYIVFGEAVPNGECWFVARIDMKEDPRNKDKKNVELWNPMNGECYCFGDFNEDPVCPLKKIWLIVGQENVWANVQEDEIPSLLSWDLGNVKKWSPFLDKERKEAHYKGGVQAEQVNIGAPEILYSEPIKKEEQIFVLENQIKKFLAGKFEDERIAQVKKTTNWNITDGDSIKKMLSGEGTEDYVDSVKQRLKNPQNQGRHGNYNPAEATYKRYFVDGKINNVLIDFEEYSLVARKGGTDSVLRNPEESKINKDEDIRQMAVQEFLNEIAMQHQKKVFAVPINCTLTSLEALWGVLKNVRMHEIDSQDVEFSLSVMLRPFPCNVFSVWMYIAVFRDDLEDD